jgi:hypothetical protein
VFDDNVVMINEYCLGDEVHNHTTYAAKRKIRTNSEHLSGDRLMLPSVCFN